MTTTSTRSVPTEITGMSGGAIVRDYAPQGVEVHGTVDGWTYGYAPAERVGSSGLNRLPVCWLTQVCRHCAEGGATNLATVSATVTDAVDDHVEQHETLLCGPHAGRANDETAYYAEHGEVFVDSEF